MEVTARIQPYNTMVNGKLRRGTEVFITAIEGGRTTHSLSRTWDVIENSPYGVGREIENYKRRHQPGFYRGGL